MNHLNKEQFLIGEVDYSIIEINTGHVKSLQNQREVVCPPDFLTYTLPHEKLNLTFHQKHAIYYTLINNEKRATHTSLPSAIHFIKKYQTMKF